MFEKIPLNLDNALEDYLHKATPTIKNLGGKKGAQQKQTVQFNDDLLIQRLQKRSGFIDGVSLLTVIILVAVILFVGYIIWLNHANKAFVALLLGGQGGSIFAAIRILDKLKKEELYTILILSQFQQADKTERKKIVESYAVYLKN